MARHDLGGNALEKGLTILAGAVARLLCAGAIVAVAATARAGQITISWDPDAQSTAVGFLIYNGPVGQPVTRAIDAGMVSSYTLTGLDTERAYHAAVTAYDELGQESELSAEVVYNAKSDGPALDTDLDGLADSLEIAGCTSPTDADTDDDGLADGSEDANRDGVRTGAETNPCAADSDADGLQDGTELALVLAGAGTDAAVFRPDLDPTTATDPLAADTDGDGLADGREDLNGNGRVDAGETDPRVADNPLLFADTFADGTEGGDPDWKRIVGSWSVTGKSKRFTSATAPVSMALIADAKTREFRSGRIESLVTLTRTFLREPDARIVFHYKDAKHYRYLRLSRAGLAIGQVGSTRLEKAGIKASLRRRLAVNAGYRVRIDIEGGTRVRVYLNGGPVPALTYDFLVNAAGRVGYRTEGAKSLFDDAAVWTDAVLR